MGYFDTRLSNNEEIIVKAKFHWIAFVKIIILLIIGLLFLIAGINSHQESKSVMLVIGIVVLLIGIIKYITLISTEMIFTNNRVIFKKGFIAIKTDEIRSAKIESISIEQSLLGRILWYGNLLFTGTGNARVKFSFIQSPLKIKNAIETEIEKTEK